MVLIGRVHNEMLGKIEAMYEKGLEISVLCFLNSRSIS